MPISNPSYFPPSRSNGSVVGITAGQRSTGPNCFLAMANAGNGETIADMLVIGANAAETNWQAAAYDGSIIIGNRAYQALDGTIAPSFGAAVNTVIGTNTAQAIANSSGSNVFVGDNILSEAAGQDSSFNVVVGSQACQHVGTNGGNPQQMNRMVVLGYQALFSIPGGALQQDSVIIGAEACQGTHFQIEQSVVIGSQCGQTGTGDTAGLVDVIMMGYHAGGADGAQSAVLIGANGTYGANMRFCVAVGGNISAFGGQSNVVVGDSAQAGNGNYNVVLGAAAGSSFSTAPTTSDQLVIEVGNPGGACRTLIRGNFGAQAAHDFGNVIFGDSKIGTDDDTVGTNTVKIINGTNGAAVAPVGGGYFYVNAGELHWIGSDNTDTKLSSGTSPSSYPDGWVIGAVAAVTNLGDGTLNSLVVGAAAASITDLGDATFNTVTTGVLAGSGGLIATTAALTDHSAGNAGTITNAPAIGNPTKWIAINDDGVLRGIPTWLI